MTLLHLLVLACRLGVSLVFAPSASTAADSSCAVVTTCVEISTPDCTRVCVYRCEAFAPAATAPNAADSLLHTAAHTWPFSVATDLAHDACADAAAAWHFVHPAAVQTARGCGQPTALPVKATGSSAERFLRRICT